MVTDVLDACPHLRAHHLTLTRSVEKQEHFVILLKKKMDESRVQYSVFCLPFLLLLIGTNVLKGIFHVGYLSMSLVTEFGAKEMEAGSKLSADFILFIPYT